MHLFSSYNLKFYLETLISTLFMFPKNTMQIKRFLVKVLNIKWVIYQNILLLVFLYTNYNILNNVS